MMDRKCRICGCTDIKACRHEDGSPCCWIDDDLCSACDERHPLVRITPATDKLLAAASSFAAAAGDCCHAARDDPGNLNRNNVADGDTLTIALDAVRLLIEATSDPDNAQLHALICRRLETTP